MATPIISVRNLSKRYTIGSARHDTLRDQIVDAASSLLRTKQREQSSETSFWALKDVSFDVQPGEVIGVIGRNGAGKSTLLKVLSQITEPTEGEIRIKGRLASLLEVGTGFHPELTGRENIFLNGVILGMTKAEIRKKFDEIVAFSEVEKFLDTPVKRYSSGMYVRLAFAVAAHLEPEILVVDEVLAVGDAQFQNKCLGKMQDVAQKQGRTVLFVSHNMSAVQVLCGRCLHLKQGGVIGYGSVPEQINLYLGEVKAQALRTGGEAIPLGRTLELRAMDFTPNPVTSGQSLDFALELSAKDDTSLTHLAVLIYSVYGTRVAILDLRGREAVALKKGRPHRVTGTIRAFPLVEGDYRVGLFVGCTQYEGDYHDLASITVASASDAGGNVPYQAVYRGLTELDYEFKCGNGSGGSS